MEMNKGLEIKILALLSVFLVGIFLLSERMYTHLEEESREGALAVFSMQVREFLDENGVVATFLGTREEKEDTSAHTMAAAEAYIERYNEIFGSLK